MRALLPLCCRSRVFPLASGLVESGANLVNILDCMFDAIVLISAFSFRRRRLSSCRFMIFDLQSLSSRRMRVRVAWVDTLSSMFMSTSMAETAAQLTHLKSLIMISLFASIGLKPEQSFRACVHSEHVVHMMQECPSTGFPHLAHRVAWRCALHSACSKSGFFLTVGFEFDILELFLIVRLGFAGRFTDLDGFHREFLTELGIHVW